MNLLAVYIIGGIILWSFLQAYNGALSVIGTLIVAILTFFSVFTSMRTLKEMKKTREDENRPYVIVYLNKEPRDVWFELCIKNFGKTAARIENLMIIPQLKTYSGKLVDEVFQNTVLMPNQKIHTLFLKEDDDDIRKFETMHVKCKYSILDNSEKYFDEEYAVNYNYTQEYAYEGDSKTSGQSSAENSLDNIATTLDIIRRQK
jgi:hypothetical protein